MSGDGEDPTVDEMLDNMGDPTAAHVECPITGCEYTGEPESVAAHVSAADSATHVWERTAYDSYVDFRTSHGADPPAFADEED